MSEDASRLGELQTALRTKMDENQTIADSFKVEDDVLIVDQERKSAFDKNMVDIKELQGLIKGIQDLDEINQWGATPAPPEVEVESVSGAVAASAAFADAQPQFKTLGQAFCDSEEFKSLSNGRNGANMPNPWQYEGSLTTKSAYEYNVKDVYNTLPTGTPGQFGSIQRDPIVIPPQRTKRVRELFPTRTTNAAIVEYFRMTGFTNNAQAVGERSNDGTVFVEKPQSTFTFVGEQAPVRTLAHWEAAHRNVLADEPQLRSIIDNELMYGLRLQEDAQILNGAGTGENLTGVLQTTGMKPCVEAEGRPCVVHMKSIWDISC